MTQQVAPPRSYKCEAGTPPSATPTGVARRSCSITVGSRSPVAGRSCGIRSSLEPRCSAPPVGQDRPRSAGRRARRRTDRGSLRASGVLTNRTGLRAVVHEATSGRKRRLMLSASASRRSYRSPADEPDGAWSPPGGRAGGTGPARRGNAWPVRAEAGHPARRGSNGHDLGCRRRQGAGVRRQRYVGTRVPASGAGYVETPGHRRRDPRRRGVRRRADPITGESGTRGRSTSRGGPARRGRERQARLDAASGSGYRQVLDLTRHGHHDVDGRERGSSYAPAGYDVLLDRGHAAPGW